MGSALSDLRLAVVLVVLAFLAGMASAVLLDQAPAIINSLDGDEDDEWWEEDEEDELEGEAEALGEAAFYGGLVLSGGYSAIKYTRRYIKLPPQVIRLSLDIHSLGNLALAPLALIHGYVNLEYAGPIEYAMAALIIILVVSGATLRYVRNRRAKIAARLVHSQRALAILLLVLALLHIARVD